jgi:hypothetical protein
MNFSKNNLVSEVNEIGYQRQAISIDFYASVYKQQHHELCGSLTTFLENVNGTLYIESERCPFVSSAKPEDN